MKIKNKRNLIFVTILGLIFLLLHFFAYIRAEIPYLTNFVPQPFLWEKIELKEEIYPSYFRPFRKAEYRYSEKGKAEIILVEKVQSNLSTEFLWDICKLISEIRKKEEIKHNCFKKYSAIENPSQNLEVILGNKNQYYNPENDGMFVRGFAGNDYANWLFFVIQYVILIALFYNLSKAISLKK